jgi:hypothetical protein
MDQHTRALIRFLNEAPREKMSFESFYGPEGFIAGGKKDVVKPCYLLAEDVERICMLLEEHASKHSPCGNSAIFKL